MALTGNLGNPDFICAAIQRYDLKHSGTYAPLEIILMENHWKNPLSPEYAKG